MRHKLFILALTVGFAAAVAIPVAVASGAHFIASATSCSTTGSIPSLTCVFKEAGLASGSTESITLSADLPSNATVSCVNGGSNYPTSKLNQTTVTSTGTFTAAKNGNIVGSLSLSPDNPCPPGQRPEFHNISYSNVTLTDNTSGATISIPGTF